MNATTQVNEKEAQALKNLKELINKTYAAKLAVKASEEAYKKLAAELTTLMESGEVDSFEADNCKVFCKPKSSITFPKDIASKRKVLAYIENKYGAEVKEEMLTINPRSFNSWYNAEAEAALAEGNLDFNLADIKPYEYFSLSFRKK